MSRPHAAGSTENLPLLRELFELGQRTHAGLVLAREDFEVSLLARVTARLRRAGLEPAPSQTREMLLTTSGADLYLVICCDKRMAGAWERLTGSYEPRLRKLALYLGVRDVEPLAADLFGNLASPAKDTWARTKLGSYLGAGTLFAWLGVILRRQVADVARRKSSREISLAQPEFVKSSDPLERAMINELSGQLRDVLHVAWETLDDRERLVVLCKYREGLGQRTIAALLGLSESRISRIVSQAVARIRSTLVRHLEREQPGRWGDDGRLWHALMHVVATHLAQAGPVEHPTKAGETRHG